MKREFFECQCHSDEHTLKFIADEDEEDPEIFTAVFLHSGPWYTRVLKGIKYIFGYKCRYGHWDCFIMKPEDSERLINLLKHNSKVP